MSTNNFYNNNQGLFVFTNETLEDFEYDLAKPTVLYDYLNDFTTLPKGYDWNSDEKEVWLEKKVKINKGYNTYVVGLVYYADGYYEGGQLVLEQEINSLVEIAGGYCTWQLPCDGSEVYLFNANTNEIDWNANLLFTRGNVVSDNLKSSNLSLHLNSYPDMLGYEHDYKISNLHQIGISQTNQDNKVINEALKQATDATLNQLGTFSNGEGVYEEI